MKLETIKIDWSGGFLTINKRDFDPTQHTVYGSAPVEPVEEQSSREEREAALLEMGWRELKGIAESLGVEKNADGWEETIPAILDAEFSE